MLRSLLGVAHGLHAAWERWGSVKTFQYPVQCTDLPVHTFHLVSMYFRVVRKGRPSRRSPEAEMWRLRKSSL